MSLEIFFRPTPDITIKADCKDIDDVFKTIGPLQEVFHNSTCGKCKSTKIRYVARKADKFDVFELYCESCGAKLALGKNDSGNLFPRRYEQDPADPKKPRMVDGKKVWLPNEGWVRWDASKEAYV